MVAALDPSLQDFQFHPDVPEASALAGAISDRSEHIAVESSSSSSESSSDSGSETVTEVPASNRGVDTILVTNGPSGCTHAMLPATLLAP